LVNGLTDPAECVEPPLAALTVFKEVPDCLLNQFIGALVVATSEFVLDLVFEICWQGDVHGCFLTSFYPLFIHASVVP
jgi:hypothetical protein